MESRRGAKGLRVGGCELEEHFGDHHAQPHAERNQMGDVELFHWRVAPGRNGTVTASAPQTSARPKYSVSSNGPIALTIRSYAMADPNAIVLPTSSAHHAHASPRRKAV